MKAARDRSGILNLPGREAWAAWLEAEHARSTGIWVRMARKGSTKRSVSHPEALEEAICYGWIDGQRKAESDETWLQRFAPRARRSLWSQVNRERAEELEAAGRMKPAGRAEIERARADGRWEAAYAGQRKAEAPEELLAALARNQKAREFYEKLDSRNRYAILFRLQPVRRASPRTRKIGAFIAMLEQGRKLHN